MRYALFSLGFFVVFTFTVFWVNLLINSTGGESTPKSSLSDRINAACPQGYTPTDWEVDGEFTDIPQGTAKVSCTAIALNKEPHLIYRSVMTK